MKIAQSLTMKESKMASTLPGLFYQVQIPESKKHSHYHTHSLPIWPLFVMDN